MLLRSVVIAVSLTAMSAAPVMGQAAYQTIQPADIQPGDQFGHATVLSDEFAIVGAWAHDSTGQVDAGAVYVYRRDAIDWELDQKLVASDALAHDRFGIYLAHDRDLLVIAAPNNHADHVRKGAVYVFRYDPLTGLWVEEQRLVADDTDEYIYFGCDVDVYGDTIVVGALRDDTAGDDAGAAYIFEFDGCTGSWEVSQKIIPDDGLSGDAFGISLGIERDVIVVGASYRDDVGVPNSGAAYVFERDTCTGQWTQTTKLAKADGPHAQDLFGHLVAVEDDRVAISCHGDDDLGAEAGAVYVFRRTHDGWRQEAKATPSDLIGGEYLGPNTIDGDALLVGSWHADWWGQDSGAVWMYNYDYSTSTWTEQGLLHAPGMGPNDRMSAADALDLHRQLAIVGAPGRNRAYIFGPSLCGKSDINQDGTVDLSDLGELLSVFNIPCP
jgi:hypothetical protein